MREDIRRAAGAKEGRPRARKRRVEHSIRGLREQAPTKQDAGRASFFVAALRSGGSLLPSLRRGVCRSGRLMYHPPHAPHEKEQHD